MFRSSRRCITRRCYLCHLVQSRPLSIASRNPLIGKKTQPSARTRIESSGAPPIHCPTCYCKALCACVGVMFFESALATIMIVWLMRDGRWGKHYTWPASKLPVQLEMAMRRLAASGRSNLGLLDAQVSQVGEQPHVDTGHTSKAL